MATVRCYRCGIETRDLNVWMSAPRCGNCDAILPLLRSRFGRQARLDSGEEPGVDAALTLRSAKESA